MLPSKPIDWLTPDPVIKKVRYPSPRGEAVGELYLPGGRGPHPGVVVCLGVVPFGTDHPQVPRLGAALARAGFAALLYWSPAMRDLRLDPGDSAAIALAYRWLVDRQSIDASRSGLLGTCVGGSFALMAAARPEIRDDVGFVLAWAPFSSMRTLACDIASASTCPADVRVPWKVDQLTRKVYVRSLTADLAEEDATLLREACAERELASRLDGLTDEGRAVYPLLTALDLDAALEALDRLPAAAQGQLDEMSPLAALGDIRAPLVVIAHDEDDEVIPIGESRRLMTALAGREGVRYTEFTMFKHLDPTQSRLPVRAIVREMGKFYLSVYPVFRRSVMA